MQPTKRKVTQWRYRSGSMRKTIYVTATIWLLSVLFALPDLVGSQVQGERILYCSPYHDDWGEWYKKFRTMFRFIVLFACPLVVITVFYTAIAVTMLCRSSDSVRTTCDTESSARQLKSRRKVPTL